MEVENEIWKTIDGYQNYQVSNLGRIKSIERKEKIKNGYRTRKEKILKPVKDSNGYLITSICKNGKTKTMKIHRLVASAFLTNPNNLPHINHRDECKTNNCVENLEYCTVDYNNKYGTRIERVSKAMINNHKKSKSVICVETNKIYPSTMEVERQFGFCHNQISYCCNAKIKQAYGYHWRYVD